MLICVIMLILLQIKNNADTVRNTNEIILSVAVDEETGKCLHKVSSPSKRTVHYFHGVCKFLFSYKYVP